MTWLNAGALAGLAAVVVPILVHLLNRHEARPQPFPTLRFLDASTVTPVRRTRLHDVALLLVRVAIVVAAALGLAQPVLRSTAAPDARERDIARVVIVDTSASMHRAAVSGGAALDVAVQRANALVATSGAATIVRTATPASAIHAAVSRLETHRGSRELVIVSDFQHGAIERTDLARIPPDITITLLRVETQRDTAVVASRAVLGASEVTAHATRATDATRVEWTFASASTRGGDSIMMLAASSDRNATDAARRAARTVTPVSTASGSHRIAIVYPGYDGRDALLRNAAAFDAPWMGDLAARVHRDATLRTAVATINASAIDAALAQRLVPLVVNDSGRAIVYAAKTRLDNADAFVVVSLAPAGSLASAALVAALVREPDGDLADRFETEVLSADTLSAWERKATAGETRNTTSDARDSEGRLLWALALLLLGVEAVMRRQQKTRLVADARVA